MRLPAIALVLIACACSSAPKQPPTTAEPTPTTEPTPPATPTTEPAAGSATGSVPDGGSCLAGSECASGVCEGEGCDASTPGTCVPAMRMCTKDLRPYCGCDGATFQTSGSCPGRRFSKREAC